MTSRLFTDDYKTTPYWWEATPRPELPQIEMPAKADVVIIGAGYTGLSAALQTTRGGRHTVVLDAEDAGWGCSTKNGGHVSTSIKLTFDELSSKYYLEIPTLRTCFTCYTHVFGEFITENTQLFINTRQNIPIARSG